MRKNRLLGAFFAAVVSVLVCTVCVFSRLSVSAEEADGGGEPIVTCDEAVVYDLFETKGVREYQNAGVNDLSQLSLGQLGDNMNAAFCAKVSYPDATANKWLYVNIAFMKASKGYLLNGGYGYEFIMKDRTMAICCDSDPETTNDGSEVTAGVSLQRHEVNAAVSKIIGVENTDGGMNDFYIGATDFELELGCVKYRENGEWTGNYVYAKINGTEVMHFVDKGENFSNAAKLGKHIGIDADGRDYTLYKLQSVASVDEVRIYDLFDLKGEKEYRPSTQNDSTQNIGKFDGNNNVAFRSRIAHADEKDHVFAMNYLILKSTASSHFANGGYGYQFLMKDNEVSIRYDKDPTTADVAGEIVQGVSLTASELDAVLVTIDGLNGEKINGSDFKKGKEVFDFEFGCAKYYIGDTWAGNYVYAKINGVEIMHFIDKAANFRNAEDLGCYTGCGADYRDYCERTFSTTYTVEDLIADRFNMSYGASIYGKGGGLRFDMKIAADAYAKLLAFVGADEIETAISYGMLIVPEDYVKTNALTTENLFGENSVYYLMQQKAEGDWVEYDGSKTPIFNVTGNSLTNYTFAGSIVGLEEYNITRNFVGLGYIKYTENGEDTYFLADYADGNIENNTRSMYQVAKAAVESDDESDTMKNNLKENYLDKVAEVVVGYRCGDDVLAEETLYAVIGQTFFAPSRSFEGYTFIARNSGNPTAITVKQNGNTLNYYFVKNDE